EDAPSFTATGPLLGVREGDELRLTGHWIDHAKFGEQFETASYVQVAPSTLEGLRRFLGSGRIRGLGPKMAARVVDAFGLETLEILDTDPGRLRQVRGIGPTTIERIRSSWEQHRGIQQIMIFLTGHGIPPGVAVKAYRRYGASAVDVVRSNPYRLAEEVFGVGFLTADRIARKLGIPEDAPERLEAGVLFALQQAAVQGHVFLPKDELLTTAADLLETRAEPLAPAVQGLEAREQIVIRSRKTEPEAVYIPRLERAEATVANDLLALLQTPADVVAIKVDQAVDWYQQRAGIRLARRQREALASALTEKAVVITGGPGTGKTTLIRGIVQILGKKKAKVLLAAPTGRAAKRLSETTGLGAKTIHRLLEFNPKLRVFSRNRHNPLEAACLVLDEISMLDVELAAALLEAVPPGCRLVLVGDADQLPSVGPGNVLRDLIASRTLPVIRLDQIFRQAERSRIVHNAHRVNSGRMPELDANSEESDFFFISRDDAGAAADLAVELAARRIPERFKLDPVRDIQVLSPMHRGELGVTRLNERLQTLLTPPGAELVVGWRHFRVGDKVMQVRNNYELDIFNGDLGQVAAFEQEERELTVIFDDRPVVIPAENLEDLVPAYACTIHKSQGSEYPAVIIVLHHQHHVMLQRNLLYTAITRGRRLVVIVGSRRALGRAVNNATVRKRHTMLAERLRHPDRSGR
ncbi:MAG: ATP-dependent RecD-like DNA helicase, partial [Thermoanaerobaculales bacterium]